MIRITIAAPVDMIPAANELSACIGYSEADRNTFTAATHEDDDGALYCVASGPVAPDFITDAVQPLSAPPWGADMDMARDAQAAIKLWSEDDPVVATPTTIAAIVSEDVDGALALLGLSRLTS